MPRRLRLTDVPRPALHQVAELADGRLLLRGPGGVTLLGGVARADLERVLSTVDGQQSVGEICDQLSGEYEKKDVLGLLRHLAAGVSERDASVVRTSEPVAPGRPSIDPERVLVLGTGALSARLAELLGIAAASISGEPDPGRPTGVFGDVDLRGRELVILALEDTAYETLFEIQRACLKLGLLSLYLTVDPDGLRIGPAVVPVAGPCIACAQIAGFRALRLQGRDTVATVAGFRTGRVRREHLEPAARAAAAEAMTLLAPDGLTPDGQPELLTSVRLLSAASSLSYAVTPAADCPMCASVAEVAPDQGFSDRPHARAARRELLDRHLRAPRLAMTSGDDLCTSIGIVGGGTAGYLTAMALRRKLPGLEVTLIESSAVPVIGVGEATTPLMPQFLHVDLGLDVHELFREVAPTLKLGIRFEWGSPGGAFNYPFGPIHVLEPAVYDGDIRRCSMGSLLIEAGAVPVSSDPRGWHSDLGVDVAYHLDNQRFVAYLRRQAMARGVRIVDAKIDEVEVSNDGETVTELIADDGRRFGFDLYVDCSGFRSLLMEKALDSRFLPYDGSLFTDRALVASMPHGGDIQPYTLAETLDAGWCWSTPQREADHRGYVFCSAFSSPEDAEREMRLAVPGMGDARLIRFRAGRHEHFWRGNVVAMGNAYGFVEPLESTALHMLIRQIGLLTGAFPIRSTERGIAALLNRRVGAWWDYLRWFLALHYRYNRRLDTPFWRHCRRETDVEAHRELIELYAERGPLSYQPAALSGIEAPDPLWGAEGIDVLLLGQKVPTRLPRPVLGRAEWQQRARLYHELAEQALPQARALELLDREPELLRRWVAAFERTGPAFGSQGAGRSLTSNASRFG